MSSAIPGQLDLFSEAKPVLVDLCCKAGGASAGYAAAGFRVIGIDVEPQPRYPFEFIQADLRDLGASDIHALGASAVAASPPCKVHTVLSTLAQKNTARAGKEPSRHHVDLIPEARALLRATGLPYVIENVVGAPLDNPVTLCGSMFGLRVRRHRLFEIGGFTVTQPQCDHSWQDADKIFRVARAHTGVTRYHMSGVIGVHGRGQGSGPGEVGRWREAMGIDWMVKSELSQAIPPAYTQHIGRDLMASLAAGVPA